MEDCSCRDRSLVSTSAAHQEASRGGPTATGCALRATEPSWPPQLSQVGTARTFSCKALFELSEGSHVILHGATLEQLGMLELSA